MRHLFLPLCGLQMSLCHNMQNSETCCCATYNLIDMSLPCVSVTVGKEIHETSKKVGFFMGKKRRRRNYISQFFFSSCYFSRPVSSRLTRQVEECVKDIKALCVVPLDKLVGVSFTDIRAGRNETARYYLIFISDSRCTYTARRQKQLTLEGN